MAKQALQIYQEIGSPKQADVQSLLQKWVAEAT